MAAQNLTLPAAADNGKQVEAKNLAPCSGFWKSPVIGWEGDVTVCTRDNRLENSLGNLNNQSFSSMWWGAQMRQRRQNVAVGNYKGLALCQSCFIPRSLNHTALTPQDMAGQAEYDLMLENG